MQIFSKKFWFSFFWLNWAIILFFWIQSNSSALTMGAAGVLSAIGSLAGLSAAYMVLVQVFLVSRIPILERQFGLDKLTRIHQMHGRWGIVLLMLHPFLLVLSGSLITGISFQSMFVAIATSHVHFIQAASALTLFIVVVFTSLYIVRKKLKYESWYAVHLFVYLAILFSFFHQVEFGHTVLSSQLFYGYWISLYSFVFTVHLTFRFIRPVFNSFRHRFTVDQIVRENDSVVSVYIKGRDLDKFKLKAGQFMIVRFLSKNYFLQAHPFSVSGLSDGDRFRLTIKELGDFTNTISEIPQGSRVLIDGPYGVFTDFFGISNKVLLIAGGIGITPIRTLAEDLLKKGKDVVIMYGNRNQKEIVFKDELEKIGRDYSAKIFYVLSDEPDFIGETGYIDEEKIRRLVPDVVVRDVFVCGPVPMMDSILKTLTRLGLPKERIHYEKFSLT